MRNSVSDDGRTNTPWYLTCTVKNTKIDSAVPRKFQASEIPGGGGSRRGRFQAGEVAGGGSSRRGGFQAGEVPGRGEVPGGRSSRRGGFQVGNVPGRKP